jgi:putative peptidoglycan lipid II flippase
VRRRIGGIDGRRVVIRHLQYLGLALVSGAVGFLILLLLGGLSGDGFALSGLAPAIVSIAIVGLAMAAVYLGLLTLFRNPELASVTKTIAARFGR